MGNLYNTGCNYYFGTNGFTKDYKMAFDYFKKAAKENDALSICRIGEMYRCGLYVKRNLRKARKYLERANKIEQDNPLIMSCLACCYYDGLKYKKAYEYFDIIATTKYENTSYYGYAMYYLGLLAKERGLYPKEDDSYKAHACACFKEAIRKKCNVGKSYYYLGKILENDSAEEALSYFLKSYNAGYGYSSYEISRMYYQKKNKNECQKWALKAEEYNRSHGKKWIIDNYCSQVFSQDFWR